MPQFKYETILPCSVEQAFELLTTTKTILQSSPPAMALNYVATPDVYHQGAIIEFQVINFGQVQTIHHEVIEFEAPNLFVETMIKGPMSHWVHSHKFEAHPDRGTIMTDEVEFDPPSGVLGFIITKTKLIDSLEERLEEREGLLLQMLKNGV